MKCGKAIITTGGIKLGPGVVPQVRFSFGPYKAKEEIKKIIINYGATIIFWGDGDKTISRRHEEDKFDKELGFLFAYYYKKCGFTKAGRKRVLDCINYDKIKTFLIKKTIEQYTYICTTLRAQGKEKERLISFNVISDYITILNDERITKNQNNRMCYELVYTICNELEEYVKNYFHHLSSM